MKKGIYISLSVFFFMAVVLPVFAEKIEQVEKSQAEIEKGKALEKRIEKKKPKTEIEQVPAPMPQGAPLAVPEGKVKVSNITVTGATLLTEKEINGIVAPYKNKELTMRDMQKAADLITDAYRKKGLVTCRAYLPPQKVEAGVLEIRVLEGITGDTEIKGNRHFKTRLFMKQIALEKGTPFNYETLRKGLSRINQLPDRHAKAVIAPGKEAGATDVVVEVADQLPIHVGVDWDNYGSRYVDKDRLRTTLIHNNLLGLDDVLVFQYQVAEGENYRLFTLRYLFPLTPTLKLGFFAADSAIDLRQEFEEEDQNARGKSRVYSLYLTQSLINKENVNLNFNVGFDYKDSFNFQTGLEQSRDRMRVAKASLDFDLTDTTGRTIINNEVSYGIGGIMGGLEKVDARCSRSGAGGEFLKDNLGLLRLQRLPFNSTLLWKNQFQFSPDILTSTEEFQAGGIINVRGYPSAEVVGDRGYSMTWEWSIPPYPLSKNIKVPFSQAKFYDALRIVTFYDWANTRLKRPTGTEQKTRTLRAAGCGLRFNLPENFSIKAEVAWPLDNTPSDNDHMHLWTEISKTF